MKGGKGCAKKSLLVLDGRTPGGEEKVQVQEHRWPGKPPISRVSSRARRGVLGDGVEVEGNAFRHRIAEAGRLVQLKLRLRKWGKSARRPEETQNPLAHSRDGISSGHVASNERRSDDGWALWDPTMYDERRSSGCSIKSRGSTRQLGQDEATIEIEERWRSGDEGVGQWRRDAEATIVPLLHRRSDLDEAARA
jgi:hypothetical protein